MKNLLKADFYRLLKNKLMIVTLVIAVALPFLMSLLYLGINTLIKNVLNEDGGMFGAMFTGRFISKGTFNLTSNFGLVLPIFTAIIISSDISGGTIRNKITLGYSRHKIFLSHFLTSATYCVVTILIYYLLTLGFGTLFLGFGDTIDISWASEIYFPILGLFLFMMVASIATTLALSTQKTAPTIIFTLLICMGMTMLSGIMSAFDYEKIKYFVYLIPTFATTQAVGTNISLVMFLEGLLGSLLFTGAFYAIGTFIFSKKDMK